MGSWFRGLRAKILLLVVVPVVVLGVVTVVAFNAVNGVEANLKKAALVRLPIAAEAGKMTEALQGTMRSVWAIYGSKTDLESRKIRRERALEWIKKFDEAQAAYEALPRSPQSAEIYKTVPEAWARIKTVVTETVALFDANTPENDEKGRLKIITALRSDTGAIEKAFAELSQIRVESTAKETKEAIEDAQTQLQMIVGLGVLAGLAIFSFGIYLGSRLANSFGTIASQIGNSASEVGMASNQLSDASQKLSSGASEAASSLEETVASLEELSSMVKSNADNASEAGQLSKSARASAEEGETEVQQLVHAMGDISQSSKKIEEIINVIDDIAFQTNLLALNAAVEAARAGEQGRGFAVVAEAVRTLALRSGDAAKDITSLIKESVDQVERGTQMAGRSGVKLKQIVTNIVKVADLNAEIAHASQEQASGLAQISKAMNQLDQATQGNAASAEETASSSEELAAEAEALRGQVRDLIFVVEGRSGEASPTQRLAPSAHSKSQPHSRAKVASVTPIRAATPAPAPVSASSAEGLIPFDDDEKKAGNFNGF